MLWRRISGGIIKEFEIERELEIHIDREPPYGVFDELGTQIPDKNLQR